MQEQFFDEYTLSHHEQLMKNKRYRDASPEEKLKILGYAHNQGAGGASKWLNTGISGSDAFGTSGTKYYNNIGKQLDKTRNDKDILFEGKVTPQIDWTSKSVPKGMSDGDARTTAFAIASSMKGAKEGPDKKTLIEFLKKGGVNMDPETSAWCAAFVNASLMQSGVKGSGSQLAKSFEKWGNPTKTPQKGDVVVLKFGNGRQHVGFFDSFNPDGSVNVLGGNQGNSVSIKRYNINSVVGFRNVPQLQSKEQKKTPAASPPKPITSTTNQEQTTHITKKKSHTKSPKKNDFVSTNKYESPHRPLDNADKIKPVPSAPKIEPVPPTAPTPAAQSPHPMKQEVVPQKINASVGTNPLPVSYVKANIRAKNKENKVAPPTNPQGLYGISFDMG
jgi:uncharacterized protein (TIGR02594 family)